MKTFYLILLSTIVGTAYAQEETNACTATADQSLVACNSAAETAKETAYAACENSAERDTCRAEADTNQASAKVQCEAQNTAQKAACGKLGEAAYDPQIDPANFSATVTNPYFPLTAGTTWTYAGTTEDGAAVTVEREVSDETKDIMGVTCTGVKETEKQGEDTVRETIEWYAQDNEGAVWLFGRNNQELDGDEVTSIDGSFVAGEEDAKPGIIMKATPAVNDVYRQEYVIQESEGVGEVLSISETLNVPAGNFTNVVKTNDTDALMPDEVKNTFYASGVGPISITVVDGTEKLELQSVTPAPTPTPTPDDGTGQGEEAPTPTPTPTPTPLASF
ncbi:hypothetical protein ACJVC5_12130 [Peredibacter sp. HCB2-198]|uniref:hypothetical protein n=1 Tax=Peredibacter sp. HCB2-198 TaxID=3383025 RepID=UPI0038B41F71